MRTLYTLNLGQENSEIEKFVLEKLEKSEEVSYILPTVAAIEKVKEYYIGRTGGFINLKFYTFDALKKAASPRVNVDEPFALYIIGKILKENNYRVLSNITEGLVEKTNNFIKRIKEEGILPEKLKAGNIEILRELADVTEKYNEFLKENSLNDGHEVSINDDRLNIKNIVIDGFYTFGKPEIEIISSFRDADIIVNIPYFFGNLEILEDNRRLFQSLDFDEVDLTEEKSIKDKILEYSDKIRFISADSNLEEALAIYQELKKTNILENVDFSDMGIAYANENSAVKSLIEDENFELNIKMERVSGNSIISEFTTVLDYAVNPDYDNIFRRIDSSYFKITDRPDNMEFILRQMNFRNLDELKNLLKENIETDDENFRYLMDLMKKLSAMPKKRGDFSYYCGYFSKYLKEAEKFIRGNYSIFNDDRILIRDMNIVSSVKKVLEKLETYNLFFGEESLENFISILKIYLNSIMISLRNDYATGYGSLIEFLYLNLNTVFICGLTDKYPDYREKNFIFSDEVVDYLKSVGLQWEEDLEIYENELVKIFSIIENSKKIYMSAPSKENYSVILDLFINDDSVFIKKEIPTKKEELFSEVVMDLRKGNLEIEKVADLNSVQNYSHINTMIYGEDNRNENEYDGYITGKALETVREILDRKYLSPSTIDNYIKSPFLFLFEDLLNVEAMDREFIDREYMEIGNIYHKILEEYFSAYPDTLEEDELEKICFRNFFERKAFGEELEGLDKINFSYHYRTILEFVKMDLNQRGKEKPEYFEKNFKFSLDDMKIMGRIDRIDLSDAGEIIIDYKRKNVPSIKSVMEFEKMQLPIYALARENAALCKYGNIEEAKYSIVFGNAEKIEKLKGKSALSSDEFNDFMNDTKERLLSLYNEMKEGHFPHKKCEYNTLEDLTRGE